MRIKYKGFDEVRQYEVGRDPFQTALGPIRTTINLEVDMGVEGSKALVFKVPLPPGHSIAYDPKLLTGSVVEHSEPSLEKEEVPVEPPKEEPKKWCLNCGNRCMEPDCNPYCAAVNPPWGRSLMQKPEECGPDNKLWIPDPRGKAE